jgi:hypothetical protein
LRNLLQVRHFDGRLAGLHALLRHARQRLVVVLGGEHAVGDRHAGGELHVGDAARRFVGDDLEVVGLAADHAAERHQGVEAAALRHGLQHQRQLQRARRGDDLHVGGAHAEALQLRRAAAEQALADVDVEAAHGDADAQAGALQVGFEFLDVVVACHGHGL